MESLFGDEIELKLKKPKIKDLVKKAIEEGTELEENTLEKALKSDSLSLDDRLELIKTNVLKILGKQKDNVIVIRDKETFSKYVSKAFEVGRIAIDTETNNSLDPITCQLMGLCLYVPGEKQAYIPVNHRDPHTKERLSWQLTEEDCRHQLQRILDHHVFIEMHNGKYDYEVIYKTCGIKVPPHWDTMICARLLNENERAGLKEQYTSKIDLDQEKYKIDHLFKKVCYADVDPYIFALYAATDSMMTDKLYILQAEELAKPDYDEHMDLTGKHKIMGLRWLFHNVEMPIVIVTAEMELRGVCVDQEFGEKLREKYTNQLADLDDKINRILVDLKPTINLWRLSKDANSPTRVYVSKKTKMAPEKIAKEYPEVDENGLRYKVGKAKALQLEDPINLASPGQLAILFYDILSISEIYNTDNRATGKNELKAIAEAVKNYVDAYQKEELEKAIEADTDDEETDDEGEVIKNEDIEVEGTEQPEEEEKEIVIKLDPTKAQTAASLCTLLLKRRGIAKLLTTYIEVIPELAQHWPDGRIRFHLSSLGTDTGRYSSGGKWKFLDKDDNVVEISGINIQNIPSHNPEIRMLFKARVDNYTVDFDAGVGVIIDEIKELETNHGFKFLKDITQADYLVTVDGEALKINHITYNPDKKAYMVFTDEGGTVKGQTRYKIVGSDYSAQEPRMTTFLSGDPQMYEAYNTGKDLYAIIARSAFNNNYEDNLEFYLEGTEIEIDGQKIICGHKTHLNKAGKERRSTGKVLNLAATYGMGPRAAGSRLGYTGDEALSKGTELLTNFFNGFKGVKKAIDDSKDFLKKNGYVEDFLGRRRRLKDINLPPYEVSLSKKVTTFNPIIGCADRIESSEDELIWNQIIDSYVILSNLHQYKAARDKGREWTPNNEMSREAYEHLQRIAQNPAIALKQPWNDKAKRKVLVRDRILDDVNIVLANYIKTGNYSEYYKTTHISDPAIDKKVGEYLRKYGKAHINDIPTKPMDLRAWTGRIAQASRQCFNARIQGSAASLTKMAMVDIYNDKRLNELDAHLIITVHDEVLVECPALYADEVEQRLPAVMVAAAQKGGDDVPQACDPYNVTRWYSTEAGAAIVDEYKKLEKGDKDKGIAPLPAEEAYKKVIANHCELPEAAISAVISGKTEELLF